MNNQPTHRPFHLAIIDSNVLSCIGLSCVLEEVVPNVSIHTFLTFEHFRESKPEEFVHCFVSSAIFFKYAGFFRSQLVKTIVLINGDSTVQIPGVLKLNVSQSEHNLVRDILRLHHHGHGTQPHNIRQSQTQMNDFKCLSPREIQVVILLVQGYINKEIADKLNISLNTVVSHRKNIMDKLGAHSLSDVVIHAVMNGYVEVGDI